MASHILSVCIFCLICVTHTHCESHYAAKREMSYIYSNTKIENISEDSHKALPMKNAQVPPRVKLKSKSKLPAETDFNEQERSYEIVPNIVKTKFRNHNLNKRNSINNKNNDNVNMSKESYINKIFNKFGDGNTMTLEGFEKFIERLDLLQILSTKLDGMKNPHKETIDHRGKSNKTCVDSKYLFSDFNSGNLSHFDAKINESILHRACPAILYNLMVGHCNDDEQVHQAEIDNEDSPSSSVWIFSILAVIVTSACGVLALAIVPVMQKKFYKSLLQFLVALAVGTLAGDAFLHLLPHAMTNSHGHHSHNHHEELFVEGTNMYNHDENMWKGVVAMLGLTFFFVMERLILLIGKWRKGRHKKAEAHSHMKFLSSGLDDLNGANSTQCMDKYNSYPYCYRDILNHQIHGCPLESGKTTSAMLDDVDASEISCNKTKSSTVGKIEENQNLSGCLSENSCTEKNVMLPENTTKNENITIILRQHGTSHHGHSHSHGHVHAAPHNFSSVAWMVIMGDGLHNFTDGMAIGAAFSGSLAGGFSTAVAVFCHELPHELGDFAMLLKAGMSIKQALFYNLLSSVLSILGNVAGICLGNTEYASSWVFAAAAGMFIYIALVDMIPELSSSHEDESNLTQCCLHLSGLMIGFGIMTIIAMYEHDLKSIFKESA
ncbi:hypothetical protein WA026_011739 [Henosepilachna vigintioctopunctata]|uniref:Zinc transporter foi n=1 Tax=Henosepilachna vigintioctopunctata TaxID=420089 RepID=A0AAW1UM65_9CUCU